jgi:peptide subunit release factor 1 (eRF1)
MIAGNPTLTAKVKKLLPNHLKNKLVDVITASAKDYNSDIVDAAVSAFVEWEENESQDVVNILQEEMFTHGLAMLGSKNCYSAVKIGQADMLILTKELQSEIAWKCIECSDICVQYKKPKRCGECGRNKFIEIDIREEMVKLAEKSGCPIEVVNHSDFLMAHGGVGCLLRYR